MSSSLKHLLLLALLPLAGCGFTPLYANQGAGGVAQQLDTVEVGNIPNRSGQMLRLTLQTQLHAAGSPTQQIYILQVNYNIAISTIGMLADTATTRNRFIATANWSLAPVGSPATPLVSGLATTEDAENIIDQQYFALSLESSTVNEQLADEIAAQITGQVAAYFKSHPNG